MSGLESRTGARFVLDKEVSKSKTKLSIKPNDVSGAPLTIESRAKAISEFDFENQQKSEERFDEFYDLGQKLYKSGCDDAALEAYKSAFAASKFDGPKLFEICKNIGNIYLTSGDLESSEEYYNKAFTLNPESDVLLVNFGTLEIQKHNMDKALERYRMAVEINPRNEKGWVGLGIVHREYGDHELAWANLERAIDINPINETALELALQWGVKDSRFDPLIEMYTQAITRSPRNELYRLNLAKVLICCCRFEQSRKQLEQLLIINPNCDEGSELLNLVSENLNLQKVAFDAR